MPTISPQETSPMKPEMSVLGIDIAKRLFHAVGMDERGKIVFRKRLSRHDLIPFRLLLDARGVDVTRAYNAIFASRRLLEVVIFQRPYQGFARFRRPCEPKTLESNKSPSRLALKQIGETSHLSQIVHATTCHQWREHLYKVTCGRYVFLKLFV